MQAPLIISSLDAERLSVGDRIDWPRPNGQMCKVRLLDVLYQPEQAVGYFR